MEIIIDIGFDTKSLLLRKLLSGNTSRMSIRAHRCGMGIGLAKEFIWVLISPVSNLKALSRAIELPIGVLCFIDDSSLVLGLLRPC